MSTTTSSIRRLRIVAVLALAFGLATVVSGGRTLFDASVRAAAEPVVPFVLGFNFVAGFAYLAAGVLAWLARREAAVLALVIALSTVLVFGALGVHIALGGAFAPRTVVAMTVRTAVWCAIAVVCWRELRRTGGRSPGH